MSLQASIKSALAANATLSAYFTGGIITVDDTPGLNAITQRASAFDTNEELKPTLVVRARNRLYTQSIMDADAQDRSFTQAVEIHAIAARSITLEVLLGQLDTVYTVLQDKRIGSCVLQIREDDIQDNLTQLAFARHIRVIYDAYGVR